MAIDPEPQPFPTAAQIPLQNFNLPQFPREAANLKHLTLTSDIKPTEYADFLATPLSQDAINPSIPEGIDSLTLELFSLGYPAPFLTRLGKALPRLKALTLYSHLIDGVSDDSRRDAGEFIHKALVGAKGDAGNSNGSGLRELHLLDAFCRKGFVSGIGDILDDLDSPEQGTQSALRFLEVSYTYRGHSDSDFLSRIPAEELPALLVSSLIAASFRLSPPASGSDTGLSDVPDDPADVDENGERVSGKKPEGIIPFSSAHSGALLLVDRLIGRASKEVKDVNDPENEPTPSEPPKLRMLDCTLYTLSLDQLEQILNYQKELAILNASVLLSTGGENTKRALLNTLQSSGKNMEVVEIVGVPEKEDQQFAESLDRATYFNSVLPSAADMRDLSAILPHLESLSMNILRAPGLGSVSWVRKDGEWVDEEARGD
ncbi:hypothetical protein BDV25DRAFT_162711 [Aspergillus avenaceus]|uniref:Uncharacterized protein n=1 Tax=Aspergillus avenaceus TaxID=36643 RepID=A0A5N6TJ09_ASPAV|nr:hypothetical protein BDV25DRAFT_162711 [Aspergillus avenaceus]